MVSKGRSSRGRVGLDRSGSAAKLSDRSTWKDSGGCVTYDISIGITVLHRANRVNSRLLKSLKGWAWLAKYLGYI